MKLLKLKIAIRNALIVLSVILLITCEEEETPNKVPTASFAISPSTGNTETLFQFDANYSTDDIDDISALQVRWQWESGGAWTNWTSEKTASHSFETIGEKEITLEVKDTEELVASTIKSLTVLSMLTVNISPAGTGSVLINPDQSEYEFDTEVNLTANPNVGYYFSEWSGDASGSLNPIIITMNSNKLINAIFEEGVFEDFNDGVADNFNTDGSGRWNVSDNAYKMSGTYANTTAYSYYPYNFNDFELSVDIKITENSPYNRPCGIYFKSQSANYSQNSYRLCITDAGSWYLCRYTNGSFYWIVEWTTSSALNTGTNAANNIKIIFVGTQMDIYFNNIYIGYVYNMTTFTSGYIGVLGYDADDGYCEYVFDNFSISTSGIKNSKTKNQSNNLRNIKGVKGDPDGNNF
ncbi:MAG: DUF1080 domain-containing protein [Bacteroidales bacterium]|nr:DUF1080 domain-containing protein [Bacteroidales bacterium]